jgi:hypothetical protein
MAAVEQMDVGAAEAKVDDGLLNRVLYALGPDGHKAMQQMQKSAVLLIGLRGLGVEIAKNLILIGISVGVHDNAPVQISDLGAQVCLCAFVFFCALGLTKVIWQRCAPAWARIFPLPHLSSISCVYHDHVPVLSQGTRYRRSSRKIVCQHIGWS